MVKASTFHLGCLALVVGFLKSKVYVVCGMWVTFASTVHWWMVDDTKLTSGSYFYYSYRRPSTKSIFKLVINSPDSRRTQGTRPIFNLGQGKLSLFASPEALGECIAIEFESHTVLTRYRTRVVHCWFENAIHVEYILKSTIPSQISNRPMRNESTQQ